MGYGDWINAKIADCTGIFPENPEVNLIPNPGGFTMLSMSGFSHRKNPVARR